MTSVIGPRASGVGSLPDVGSRDAVRQVRDLLVGDASDAAGIPYVPEQPTRGPGADMIGRTADLLVEMAVDLQPSGWRLTPPGSAPGRDLRRAQGFLQQDLDEVAEAYDGYSGPLKTQVCGPWTLAASLWMPRGERVVSDAGASLDLAQSLAAGIVGHVEHLRRLVPGAEIIVQLDEPSLPAVLAGSIRSRSGMRRLHPVDEGRAGEIVRDLAATVQAGGASVTAHCCAPDAPITLLRRAGVEGLALDTSLVSEGQFDAIGEAVDGGVALWAGLVPPSSTARHPREHVEALARLWNRIGFGAAEFDRLVLTPACGLATVPPQDAVRIQRLVIDAASMLGESAA